MKSKGVQVFGEHELLDRILKGKRHYSHCISIRSPDQEMPDYLPPAFAEVLELKFYDILEDSASGRKGPTEDDANRIVEFVTRTRQNATGYTLHCWGGHSRSTAAALAVLYLLLGSEGKAVEQLLKVRPDPRPSPNTTLLRHFDKILGSNLLPIGQRLQAEFQEQLRTELTELFPEDGIEELPVVQDAPGLLARAEHIRAEKPPTT